MPERRPFDAAVIPEELAAYKPHLLPRQPEDKRDYRAKAFDRGGDVFPTSWRIPLVTPIFNQATLGSCVGAACAAMLENFTYRTQGRTVQYSPLQAYYVGRLLDGTTGFDAGTWTRSVLKGLQRWGAVPEELWTYSNGDYFKATTMPDKPARFQGAFHKGFRYVACETLDDVRSSIAQGYGVVAIVPLYETFYRNAYFGTIPYPTDPYEGMRGGHAMWFMGYDDALRVVYAKNSWGRDKGDGGIFAMSYDYWTKNDVWDAWSLRPI